MYNKVIMMGFITRNIELKYLPSGIAISTIGLASNRKYKKQDGSMGEEVCFIDVKLFGRAAEVANEYLRKGSKILIEGRLQLESWTDQNGNKKSKHLIFAESMKMLDSKEDKAENESIQDVSNQNQIQNAQTQAQEPQNANANPDTSLDEEKIPF